MKSTFKLSYLFACLALMMGLFPTVKLEAQDSIREPIIKHVFIKGYPLSFFAGELWQYTCNIKVAVEYRIDKHNGIQFGFGAVVPDYVTVYAPGLFTENFDYFTSLFFGGNGSLSYRYYFTNHKAYSTGLYWGVEVSYTGLRSFPTYDINDNYTMPNFYVGEPTGWNSPEYRAHTILNKYRFSIGRGYYTKHNALLDIGFSAGYQYAYFWRQYPEGNIEFEKIQFYGFLKSFPVFMAFNLGIGGGWW